MPTQIGYVSVNNTSITVFTSPAWTLLQLRKESAGTVVVGTQDGVKPGNGMTLPSSDFTLTLVLAPDTTIYAYAANAQALSYVATPLAAIIKGGLQAGQAMSLVC